MSKPPVEPRQGRQVRLEVSQQDMDPNQEMPRRLTREQNQERRTVQDSDDEMPRRKTSVQTYKRRESSHNTGGLSLAALQEHESNQNRRRKSKEGREGGLNRKDSVARSRRRTITESSAVTDNSTDDESQPLRSMSLYGVTMSLRAMRVTRRLSISSFPRVSDAVPPPRIQAYENTYIMEVKEDETFKAGRSEAIMRQILGSSLDGVRYSAQDCPRLSCSLANLIKTRLQQLNMPRFRLVCHVVIGQKLGQGFRCASRCLWQTETDGNASVTYENASLFAVATVYGIYFD